MPFDREAYNACMKPYLSAEGDHKLNFCIGAKVCSGKADVAEAKRVCLLPKPPKPAPAAGTRRGSGKCLTQVDAIVECLVKNTDFTATDMSAALAASVPLCVCGKKPSKAQKEAAVIAGMSTEQRQALDIIAQMKAQYAPEA